MYVVICFLYQQTSLKTFAETLEPKLNITAIDKERHFCQENALRSTKLLIKSEQSLKLVYNL